MKESVLEIPNVKMERSINRIYQIVQAICLVVYAEMGKG